MKFLGYARPDGKVGVRNHVLIIPTTICSADVARMIARAVPETSCLNNQNGCGQVPGDQDITRKTLIGYAAHPNVFGVLLIGLGCEQIQAESLRQEILARAEKPVHIITIQKEGGIQNTLTAGVKAAQDLIAKSSLCERVPCHLSELILGTECGGSDPTSGLSANIVVGNLSDRIVAGGGTVVLSETPEMLGAEHVLAAQAVNKQVGEDIISMVRAFEAELATIGENLREGNPSPGNIQSGISTLEEKSLGCIYKAGTTPIQAVYSSGEEIDKKGLVIMDTVAYDVVSVGEMIIGGSQVVVFTTGLGNPVGSPIAPVIKVTGNRKTYEKNADFLDFDTSETITGGKSAEDLGAELLDLVIATCEGKTTKAEEWGMTDIAINHLCTYC